MGYLDARLIDITRAAKCSAGSFYTYGQNNGTLQFAGTTLDMTGPISSCSTRSA